MAFGFYFPTKSDVTAQKKGSASWIPSDGPVFPIGSPEDYSSQIILRSGDGTIHVQDQGDNRKSFLLNFKNSPQSDAENYRTFFKVVKKSFHQFQYEDGGGNLHTVRIMNGFNFKKDRVLSFSGSIQLEVE